MTNTPVRHRGLDWNSWLGEMCGVKVINAENRHLTIIGIRE
ncbi:hypothetical protein [Actinoplanes sp. NPDC049118]